jgi:hypothetical protein
MTRGEIAYDGTVWPVEGSVAARQYICPFGFSPSALEDRFAAIAAGTAKPQCACLAMKSSHSADSKFIDEIPTGACDSC